MAEAESYKAGLLQWDASTLSLRLDLLGFVTSLRIKWLFDRAEDVDVGTSLPLLVVDPETCKQWEETYSELTSESWYTKPTGYTYCLQRMAIGPNLVGENTKIIRLRLKSDDIASHALIQRQLTSWQISNVHSFSTMYESCLLCHTTHCGLSCSQDRHRTKYCTTGLSFWWITRLAIVLIGILSPT